jgi:hypothetical protein
MKMYTNPKHAKGRKGQPTAVDEMVACGVSDFTLPPHLRLFAVLATYFGEGESGKKEVYVGSISLAPAPDNMMYLARGIYV